MGHYKVNLIGVKNKNNKGYEYEVIEDMGKGKWKIHFLESNYEAIRDTKEVKNGNIRDWRQPYVCGVGIVSEDSFKDGKKYLYDRWRDMLRRCYDKNSRMYYTYGAVGVYVDDRWKYFENFVNDMELKDNIEKLKEDSKNWQIDKDIICNEKGINPHYYSNDTVKIITRKENTKERNDRKGNPSYSNVRKVMQFDVKGNYIKTWNSITEAGKSCTKSTNYSPIISCCKNKGVTAFGYCWCYEEDFINCEISKKDILYKIKNNKKRNLSNRKLIQIIDNGEIVLEDVCENLTNFLNVSKSGIYGAINKGNKCGGYIVRYKGEM